MCDGYKKHQGGTAHKHETDQGGEVAGRNGARHFGQDSNLLTPLCTVLDDVLNVLRDKSFRALMAPQIANMVY